jgi:uncharacterized protein (TIRG00374 family)
LFWGLPVVILYVVFRQIDFVELKTNILRTNAAWLALGVAVYFLAVFIAALRWHVLLKQNFGRDVSLGFSLRHHWIGLALGAFVPAQIGADIYRALAGTRRFGRFGLNVSIVLVQKVLTLMICMALVLLLYPTVSTSFPPEIDRVHQLSYILLLSAVFLIFIAAVAIRSHLLSAIQNRLGSYLAHVRRKTLHMLDREAQEQDARIPLRIVLKPWGDPKQLLPGFFFSIAFMLAAAVRGQIFFQALGYDLPFVFNLFASPVLVLVFTLPISFGSLGIREAAFILVYGLFGVPAEIALTVSFFNLFGILLNSLTGGVVMLISNARLREGTGDAPRDLLRMADKAANQDAEHAA